MPSSTCILVHMVLHVTATFSTMAVAQSNLAENEGIRCYAVKIQEREKVGSHQKSNPGYLWLEPYRVHIQDCEGWWLSGCRDSVAEHWWLKPELSWVQLLVTASLFTFLLLIPLL